MRWVFKCKINLRLDRVVTVKRGVIKNFNFLPPNYPCRGCKTLRSSVNLVLITGEYYFYILFKIAKNWKSKNRS
jgi:hypothetical protein